MTSGLKQRVITGIVLIISVFLGVLYLPATWFAIFSLIAIITLGGLEWGKLVSFKDKNRAFFVVALIALAVITFFLSDYHSTFIIIGVLWWVVVLVLLATYQKGTTLYKNKTWLLRISAFFVLIPAWLALINLHQRFPELVLYLILLVAIADSGAYFTGKAFGKNKLAPELSPGKTREGALGGLAGAAIWSILGAFYFYLPNVDWLPFILLSLVVALMSVAGDLFESLIKREAGQKDSGNILPGHGGILDRIDGLLAALPIFALGIAFIDSVQL